jgi:hypothetical protein
MIQLSPPLWLETPHGLELCHFVIDYGIELDLYWVCFHQKTRRCWVWENKDIRICINQTIGRIDGTDNTDGPRTS